jgi:hypothetical protein
MNTINQTEGFSAQRLWATISNQLTNNNRLYLLGAATMIGVFVLITISICINLDQTTANLIDNKLRAHSLVSSAYAIYAFMAYCFAVIVGSMMFSNFKHQPSRISELMLPASMAEKFVARLIIMILGSALVSFIATLCGEMVRYIYLTPYDVYENLFSYAINCAHDDTVVMLSITMAMQALFALGSCISPTYSFFKTFLAMFLFMLLITMLPDGLIYHVTQMLCLDTTAGLCVNAFIVTIVAYYLTWCRFRHIQVVQRFLAK